MSELISYIEKYKEIINLISVPLSLLALLVGFVALWYTIKMFYMKKGIDVRCSYSVCSSIECDDRYVSNFILENRKDKSIVIFHTYLKLGHNYYLELENFENEPLIIKPFEVYKKNFDPLLFYSVSMKRINLDRLFDNKKVKKKILLYTTEGIYEVKAHINMRHPMSLFFKNYATAIININRLHYYDKAYGINTKFIVEFVYENNEKIILPLQEDSYRTQFDGFVLNQEDLKNKENLESFFQEKINTKILKNIKSFSVVDFEKAIKNRLNNFENDKVIQAKYYNFLTYYVTGKVMTFIEQIDMKLRNYFRKNRKQK